MNKARIILVCLLSGLLGGSLAGQTGLHREGSFWVETTTGSESVGAGDQLRISTIGNVTVRGGSGGQVTYSINRKVRARNAEEARDELQEAGVNVTRQGHYVRLVVNDATGPVDLQIAAPHALSRVIVETDVGNIEVMDIDGGVAAKTDAGNIRLNHVKGSVDVNSSGGTLQLGDVGGSAHANSAAGDITAGTIGGDARLETAGGDITVQKVNGSIRAITAGGNLHIVSVGGSVVGSTAGGLIDIGRAGGVITVHNAGGGPITVGSADGGARCENASGAIKVSSVTGALRLSTAAGSVIAQIQGARLLTDSYVSTGSGDITVYLPSNLGVTIRAENDGATRAQGIVSEFSALQVHFDGATVTARGELNGGGPVLHIDGTGGMIWIKKK